MELLDQFHIKESHLVTLSCFMNKINFRSLCRRFSFDGLLVTRESPLVDHTCEMMVGTTIHASSSNYVVVKFVKFLNNVRLAYITANTSETPMAKSTDCPLPSSISM